jgi:hypothetical protein
MFTDASKDPIAFNFFHEDGKYLPDYTSSHLFIITVAKTQNLTDQNIKWTQLKY